MKDILASLISVDGNKTQQPCLHLAFVNNLCTDCKNTKTECDNPTTLPFRYLHRDLSLTVDAIQRLRDVDLQNLLNRKKLHLLLDLDNTLVHTTEKTKNNKSGNDNDVYEILNGQFFVKLRPGTRNFLNKAAQLFDLTIYTRSSKPYAKQVAKLLESETVRFSSVIYREACIETKRKSLEIVLSHQRVVLIVDDLEKVWDSKDRDNLIKIRPYTFFQNGVVSRRDYDDHELNRVWRILKKVHTKFFDKKNENYNDTKDVREVLNNSRQISSIIKDVTLEFYSFVKVVVRHCSREASKVANFMTLIVKNYYLV